MPCFSTVQLALAAAVVEAAVGYPGCVYRAIGHPVTWMGALLGWLELRLNYATASEGWQATASVVWRRLLGVFTLCVLLGATACASWGVERGFGFGPIGAVLLVLAATSLIAQRSLYDHVRAVAEALERDGLEGGRQAVSMIVGRNPARLDEAGVARAAIESLAENFSDGVVAVAFWLAVAGLPGGAVYKAVNTADSMIGHRTPRYAAFGWAAARVDDVVNLPASRLAALFLVLGAFTTGDSPLGGWRAVMRDASRHRSPNAGWPEAAMAGALGLKLAGPRVYGDEMVADAFMGDGNREATAADIRRALRLFRAACVTAWLMLLAIAVISRC
jgi:adenosylcobinamide-phosphate synthase